MNKNKKIFIAKVIINGKNAPDFGLGKGVLSEQEMAFTDDMDRGFNSPLFLMAKIEHEDKFLRDVCRVEWEEKLPKKKINTIKEK